MPYEKYGHLGANLATKIEVNQAITFAGVDLDASSYRLYAFPQESYWELIVHTDSVEPETDLTALVLVDAALDLVLVRPIVHATRFEIVRWTQE